MSSNSYKRGNSNRSNNSNNIKRKSNQPHFIDRAFLPRVKEYLDIQQGTIDEDDVVEYLQSRYHEYSRKKRNVLRLSVEKAIDTLNSRKTFVEDDPTTELEKRYLRKRQKRSKSLDGKMEVEISSDDSFEATDEELVFYKDTNAMNNSMQNLYKNQSLNAANATAEHKDVNDEVAKEENSQNLLPTEEKLSRSSRTPSNDSKRSSTSTKANSENLTTPTLVSKSYLGKNFTLNEAPATVPLIRKGLSTISEDEKSISSSRPNTPLNKSTKSRTGERTKEKAKKFEPSTSTVTFKDIGGYDSCIMEVSKLILHLKHPEVFSHLGIKPPRGFLLHGAPGCGKTLLANAIAGELKVPFYKVAAPEVVSGISGESEQKIRALFNEARMVAPSIIFIDEIDSITPKRENAGKEMERRVVTQILSCMDELSNIDSHVLVIGATNRVDSLDPALRRAGRFDREIAMGIPDRKGRKSILQVICQKLRLEPEFNYDKIASCTPGFVGADIQALAREAAIHAVDCAFQNLREKEKVAVKLFVEEQVESTPLTIPKTQGETSELTETSATSWLRDQPPLTNEQLKGLFITTEHFVKAKSSVQPSAKREGFATVPDVTWDDIGALEDIRDELTMAIMAPVQNPEEFEALGLSTPPGILLAGPPGCGKTLLAKAIANEAGINFISVKGPELLNMYVGESEKAVRQVFVRARNSSPCVIFFDEIDALCPRRSLTGDSNVSSRVVNQLLTEMDGLEARKQVFIMGATNRPDILDGAIMRPGRLDKLLYVGLPNVNDRTKILQTITKNGTKPRCGCDVAMDTIGADIRCEGYSGADLSALVREASVAALKEFMLSRKIIETEIATSIGESLIGDPKVVVNPTLGLRDVKDISVTMKHFDVAFEKVKPSVSGKDRKWYDEMKQKHTKK